MRFVLGFLMPLAIPVHLAVGVAGFRALLRTGDDSVNSFDDPKVMTKLPNPSSVITARLGVCLELNSARNSCTP